MRPGFVFVALAFAGCGHSPAPPRSAVAMTSVPSISPSDRRDDRISDKRATIRPYQEWDTPTTVSHSLGRIGPAAVPALVQELRNPDPRMRRKAAEVLGRIGPQAKDAVAELTASLQDPDEEVRRLAARALGQIGPAAADAVPELMRMLKQSVHASAAGSPPQGE